MMHKRIPYYNKNVLFKTIFLRTKIYNLYKLLRYTNVLHAYLNYTMQTYHIRIHLKSLD
jgi:hypothetical protein